MRPLEGVRVLAVEQMQAMPFATQLMARLGADVVKVEHPTRGDLGRGAQPAITDPEGRNVGATFLRNNSEKRSLGLDLKHPDGRGLLLELAPRFDVLAENFKPGTMARFGLGYDEVRAVAPGLVYASISGFGNLGASPYAHWPAFAPIAEAMSGLYNFNRPAGAELKVSPAGALGDTGSGLFALVGILAALRQRETTGEGCYVDIAMFDAMVSFADLIPNYWSLGKDPRTPTAMINDGFPIERGEVVIQIGREYQFERLCELLGRDDWPSADRFATREGWLENLGELRDAVQEWAGDRSAIDVADALAAAGIAAAPVFDAADVVADPHLRARRMIVGFDRPDGGDRVLAPGNPVRLSTMPEEVPDQRPPWLGEHTDAILRRELGLDDDRLSELRSAGAIA